MDNFPVSAQFNISPFGRVINLTFNEVFLSELTKALVLDEQIAEDFFDFNTALTECKTNPNLMAASKDKLQNEFAVFKFNGVYNAILETVFAKDLAYAIIDSVRLYSEGSDVVIGPLFAFAKRLEAVLEQAQKFGNVKAYGGRGAQHTSVPFNRRGFNVR